MVNPPVGTTDGRDTGEAPIPVMTIPPVAIYFGTAVCIGPIPVIIIPPVKTVPGSTLGARAPGDLCPAGPEAGEGGRIGWMVVAGRGACLDAGRGPCPHAIAPLPPIRKRAAASTR